MEPDLGSVFVANGTTNMVHVFDKNDGKFVRNMTIKRGNGCTVLGLGAEPGADGLLYVATGLALIVLTKTGEQVRVIRLAARRVAVEPSGPRGLLYVAVGHRILVFLKPTKI